MSKKRIFITGISSEIMLRLVKHIDFDDYDIIGLSRAPSKVKVDNVQLIKGDILEIDNLEIDFSSVDIIIHAAAITHSFDIQKYYDVNLKATQNLVTLAKANPFVKFVFISSRTAGEQSGAYGISKLRAEQYIQSQLKNWLIFRPAEVFGASEQEGIEDLIRNTIKKPYALCPIQIASPMYPIFVDDLIDVLYKYTFSLEKRNAIITVAGSKAYSFKEVIQLTAKLAEKQILIIPLPKLVMMSIKTIASILPFSIGVLPDQIDRLYSKKEHETLEGDFKNFEDYVIEIIRQD